MISTESPSTSVDDSGTRRPLMREPMHRCPVSALSVYARSTGVASTGSSTGRPTVVNTMIWDSDRSHRSDARNWPGSAAALSQSSRRCSHSSCSARAAGPNPVTGCG
jgi:hypothetical protein